MASVFGGRPGMISGATGAMAIIAASLVKDHGLDMLFPAIVLAGLLQLVVGACKLGKLIRLVPHPVMLGFVNGLAIVICLGQFETFKTTTVVDGETIKQWLPAWDIFMLSALAAVTMAYHRAVPKITKAVPSTLVAIVAVSLVVIFLCP